ncbi:hypothetical protein F3Y22_tig00113725pilonHSYRG00378 [Hibiscus syriacus]|uniref:Peptidase S9A N-terminal domain-containing protein n=1 Tax=Hibiscus syriacus TaxID=106335 RepID=A0A6A2XSQ9_HIBSY|nr:hypothetical protein F3Y22_tig00113725pilonHSYRG00378 [Hibiscus syriacus]
MLKLSWPTLNACNELWLYYEYIPEGKEYPVLCRRFNTEKRGWAERLLSYVKAGVGREKILLDWNEVAEKYDSRWAKITFSGYPFGILFMLQVKDLRNGCIVPRAPVDGVVSLAWDQDSRTLVLRTTIGVGNTDDTLVFTENGSSYCVDLTRTKDGKFITVNSNSRSSSEEVYVLDSTDPLSHLQKLDVELEISTQPPGSPSKVVSLHDIPEYIKVRSKGRLFCITISTREEACISVGQGQEEGPSRFVDEWLSEDDGVDGSLPTNFGVRIGILGGSGDSGISRALINNGQISGDRQIVGGRGNNLISVSDNVVKDGVLHVGENGRCASETRTTSRPSAHYGNFGLMLDSISSLECLPAQMSLSEEVVPDTIVNWKGLSAPRAIIRTALRRQTKATLEGEVLTINVSLRDANEGVIEEEVEAVWEGLVLFMSFSGITWNIRGFGRSEKVMAARRLSFDFQKLKHQGELEIRISELEFELQSKEDDAVSVKELQSEQAYGLNIGKRKDLGFRNLGSDGFQRVNGVALDDPENLKQAVQFHFQEAFNGKPTLAVHHMSLPFKKLHPGEVRILENEFTEQEVFQALKNFYANGRLEDSLNYSYISLIPKKPSPSSLNDFRPISLVGRMYKFLTFDLKIGEQSLRDYCIIQVGDVKRVKFWQDLWIGNRPLMTAFPRMFVLVLNKEGTVAEFGTKIDSGWVWDIQFKCKGTSDGSYTIKAAEALQFPSRRADFDWKALIKQSFACYKVEAFVWRVLLRRVLVCSELVKREIVSVAKTFLGIWGISTALPDDPKLFLSMWKELLFTDSKCKIVCGIIPLVVILSLWLHRNELVLNGKKLDVKQVFFSVKRDGGIGGVLQNNSGELLLSFSLSIGNVSPLIVEVMEVEQALDRWSVEDNEIGVMVGLASIKAWNMLGLREKIARPKWN